MSDFKHRVLDLAAAIDSGKADYISPDAPGRKFITNRDYDRLTDIAGEILFFDDECGVYPTDTTRSERVLFLCFAATA
jgi:hypothetical protein